MGAGSFLHPRGTMAQKGKGSASQPSPTGACWSPGGGLALQKISWAGLSLPADVCLCLSEWRRGWRELCLLALGQGELAMVEQAWEEWDGPDPGYGVNGAPSSLYFWNLEFFGALGERSNSMWCQALSDEKSGRERERKRCWFMDAFMCLFIYTFICVS